MTQRTYNSIPSEQAIKLASLAIKGVSTSQLADILSDVLTNEEKSSLCDRWDRDAGLAFSRCLSTILVLLLEYIQTEPLFDTLTDQLDDDDKRRLVEQWFPCLGFEQLERDRIDRRDAAPG